MAEVAKFWASLGFKTDFNSIRQANRAMWTMRRSMMGVVSYFGAQHLGKALLGFNANVQDAKNQIAGMLALTKHTSLNDQLETAGKLYDGLRAKAAELPGTTEDYVNMLTMIVRPLSGAGFNVQEIQDMTVNAMIAAKGLGESWQVAGRDIDEATMGKFGVVDKFSRKVLEGLDGGKYTGLEGRARFKALTKEQRAREFQRGLSQPQFAQMGAAQADSFSGRVDKIKEQVAQFLGAVGLPLFKALGESLERINTYLTEHKEEVKKVAAAVGGVLLDAFRAVSDVIKFIINNESVLRLIMVTIIAFAARALAVWVMVNAPLMVMIGMVWAAVEVFQHLKDKLGFIPAAIAAIGTAMLLSFGKNKLVNMVTALIVKMWGLATASKAAAAAVAMTGGIGMDGGIGMGGRIGVNATKKAGLLKRVGGMALGLGKKLAGFTPVGRLIGTAMLMDEFIGATDVVKGMDQLRAGMEGKRPNESAPAVGAGLTANTTININGVKDAEYAVKQLEATAIQQTNMLRQALRGAGGK